MQILNAIYAILGIGSILAEIAALIWWGVDVISEKRRQKAHERLLREFDKVKENSLDNSKEDGFVNCRQKDNHQ